MEKEKQQHQKLLIKKLLLIRESNDLDVVKYLQGRIRKRMINNTTK